MVYFNIEKLDDLQIISLVNKGTIKKDEAFNEFIRRYGKEGAFLRDMHKEVYK